MTVLGYQVAVLITNNAVLVSASFKAGTHGGSSPCHPLRSLLTVKEYFAETYIIGVVFTGDVSTL